MWGGPGLASMISVPITASKLVLPLQLRSDFNWSGRTLEASISLAARLPSFPSPASTSIGTPVVGSRNMRKALLFALLEPRRELVKAECRFDYTSRLAISEEAKSLPWPAVWEFYCESRGAHLGLEWLRSISKYEADVLSTRN